MGRSCIQQEYARQWSDSHARHDDAGSPAPLGRGHNLQLTVISGILDHVQKEDLLSLLAYGPGDAS